MTTSLSLLPPGGNKVKEEEEEGEGSEKVEEEEMGLMKMMRKMIAEEVRCYVDSLRADGKLVGLGSSQQ